MASSRSGHAPSTPVVLDGLIYEPRESVGMAAALQATAASARTRLGIGPRFKAHLDRGAWATMRDGHRASDPPAPHPPRAAFASDVSPGSAAHGYADADGDATGTASGELVSDLAAQLEALGGATPHPALALAAECVADHDAACGGGGTWALVLAALLVGAAERLRADEGVSSIDACDAFQEAHRIARAVVDRCAAPLGDIVDAYGDDTSVLERAIRDAKRAVKRIDDPEECAKDDFTEEEAEADDAASAASVSSSPADLALAALALGFDRERHPGDAALVLGAALVASNGVSNDPTTRLTDLGERVVVVAETGPAGPSRGDAIVPGVRIVATARNLPDGGGEMGRGLSGDPADVASLRSAIEALSSPSRVRALTVLGSVKPPPGDEPFEARRERYAERVAAVVRERCGGRVDALFASGTVDAACVAALEAIPERESEGGKSSDRPPRRMAVLASLGRKKLMELAALTRVRPTRDILQCDRSDVVTNVAARARAGSGWDPEGPAGGAMFFKKKPSSKKGGGGETVGSGRFGDADPSCVVTVTPLEEGGKAAEEEEDASGAGAGAGAGPGGAFFPSDEKPSDERFRRTEKNKEKTRDPSGIPRVSTCTAVACAPSPDVAESRRREIWRNVRRVSNALEERGDGEGAFWIWEKAPGASTRSRRTVATFDPFGREIPRKHRDDDPAGVAAPGAGALEFAIAAEVAREAEARRREAAAKEAEAERTQKDLRRFEEAAAARGGETRTAGEDEDREDREDHESNAANDESNASSEREKEKEKEKERRLELTVAAFNAEHAARRASGTASALAAFAEAARDVARIAAQNAGASFSRAVEDGRVAEAEMAAAMLEASERARRLQKREEEHARTATEDDAAKKKDASNASDASDSRSGEDKIKMPPPLGCGFSTRDPRFARVRASAWVGTARRLREATRRAGGAEPSSSAEWGSSSSEGGGGGGVVVPLEEARCRSQGLNTAMAIVRTALRTGALLTRAPTKSGHRWGSQGKEGGRGGE